MHARKYNDVVLIITATCCTRNHFLFSHQSVCGSVVGPMPKRGREGLPRCSSRQLVKQKKLRHFLCFLTQIRQTWHFLPPVSFLVKYLPLVHSRNYRLKGLETMYLKLPLSACRVNKKQIFYRPKGVFTEIATSHKILAFVSTLDCRYSYLSEISKTEGAWFATNFPFLR